MSDRQISPPRTGIGHVPKQSERTIFTAVSGIDGLILSVSFDDGFGSNQAVGLGRRGKRTGVQAIAVVPLCARSRARFTEGGICNARRPAKYRCFWDRTIRIGEARMAFLQAGRPLDFLHGFSQRSRLRDADQLRLPHWPGVRD